MCQAWGGAPQPAPHHYFLLQSGTVPKVAVPKVTAAPLLLKATLLSSSFFKGGGRKAELILAVNCTNSNYASAIYQHI